MWLTNCNLSLQHAAAVVKHQQIDNITALFYVVMTVVMTNVLLLSVDAFDEQLDKITQFVSDACLCYSLLSFYSVNFILIFQTIAKILQIYRGGILIWAAL